MNDVMEKYEINNPINVKYHSILYDLALVGLLALFVIFSANHLLDVMNILTIAIYSFCVFVQLKEKRYASLCFYITFFLFLLDTVFFGIFNKEYKYKFPSSEVEEFALICLVVAIIGVYFGSVHETKYKLTIGNLVGTRSEENISNTFEIPQIQSILKWSSIICTVFSMIEALVKVAFVQANSYVAYYSDFQTPLPYFVIWISAIAPILFYFYLGTRPEKRSARIPIFLYLMVGVISLFYGQRNIFVMRAILVFCYALIRNSEANTNDKIWISKSQIRALLLIAPLGIIFMSFWGSYRFDNEYNQTSIFQSIIDGLLDQGNCISILDFEYRYGEIIPKRLYALGGIISFLHNNIVSRILRFSSIPVTMHTVETAINGYSYEAAVMYLQNRNGYLMGFGIGSCYIAELFNSFGYIGVFFGSYIYGLVLRKLNTIRPRGFIGTGIALYMFQRLLMAPRSTYDSFISTTFQAAHLFVFFIVIALIEYYKKRLNSGDRRNYE